MKQRLGHILSEMGVVDGMQLQSALAYQRKWGVPLGQVVVDLRFCSAEQVLHALALQTGVPGMNLDAELLNPSMREVLPRRLAEQYRVVPLRLEGPRGMVLSVAIAAPASLQVLDAVRSVTRKARVVPHLATDAAISRALERLYQEPLEAPRRLEREPILLPDAEPDTDTDMVPWLESEAPRAMQQLPDLSPEREVMELPLLEPLEVEELARLLELVEVPAGAGEVLLYGWGAVATRGLMQTLGEAGLHASVASTHQVLEAEAEAVVLAPLPSLEALERLPRAQLLVAGKEPDRDVVRAQALGARGFLTAPLDPDLMLRAVRRLMGSAVPVRVAS